MTHLDPKKKDDKNINNSQANGLYEIANDDHTSSQQQNTKKTTTSVKPTELPTDKLAPATTIKPKTTVRKRGLSLCV